MWSLRILIRHNKLKNFVDLLDLRIVKGLDMVKIWIVNKLVITTYLI